MSAPIPRCAECGITPGPGVPLYPVAGQDYCIDHVPVCEGEHGAAELLEAGEDLRTMEQVNQ